MHRLLGVLLFMGVSLSVFGQFDYKWPVASFFSSLTFSSNPPQITYQPHPPLYAIGTAASIYDSVTARTLYSEGQHIVTDNFDTLANAYPLTDTAFAVYFPHNNQGVQNSIFLPKNSNEFYLVYPSVSDEDFHKKHDTLQTVLYYAVVQRQNNGYVLKSKRNRINYAPTSRNIIATRHGNGRDWWLVQKEGYNNKYFIFLVTPDTIRLMKTQVIGDSILGEGYGYAKFSEQGDKYVFSTVDVPINILDFDRCEGVFTGVTQFTPPFIGPHGDTLALAAGITGALSSVFSPSGRYLYVNNYWTIRQYDLQAPDILSSAILICKWDSATYDGQPNPIGHGLLTPFGEIYYDTWDLTSKLHVIHAPDSPGLACRYEPMAIPLLHQTYPLPNLPSYKTGKLIGSGCDTTFTTNIAEAQKSEPQFFRLVENPVHGQLNIAYKFTCAMEYKIDVIDLQGRPLRHYQNHGLEGNLFWDIGDLSSGNYLIKATYGSGAVDMIKFTLIP
ncbi:MAG: hypothetical protein U0T84_12640 [Chitinophagales bacterium]